MVRLQGRSVRPGYIRVGKATKNVISQNGVEEGKTPSGPIETMQCSCDNCRLERWYPPHSTADDDLMPTAVGNSKFKSQEPSAAKPILYTPSYASRPVLLLPFAQLFLSTSTTLKRLPALLFTLKTFHANLIKTVVAVMPVVALGHL